MQFTKAIDILQNSRNNIEDRIIEVDEGEYLSRFPKENIEQYRKRLVRDLKEINSAIEALRDIK